jgi:hypothetical protein
MPFERDPLSVEYDGWAAELLNRAISTPYAHRAGRIRSPRRDPIDAKGLSMHERAATRSLYYLVMHHPVAGPLRGSGLQEWSLRVDWGEAVNERRAFGLRRGDRVRQVLVVVTPYWIGRRMVAPGRSYTARPPLRSRGELPGDDWRPRQGEQPE